MTDDDKEYDTYARLSDAEGDGDGLNCADQIALGRKQLEALGLRVGLELVDNSVSAYDPNADRKAFKLAMRRLLDGKSAGIWVLRIDRLTRQIENGAHELILKLAKTRGIRIFTAGGEVDLLTPDGRAAFRDAVNKATHSSEVSSVRIRDGKRRVARDRSKDTHGGPTRFGMPGLLNEARAKAAGWDPNGDSEYGDVQRPRKSKAVVEAQREILNEIARRIVAGETLRSIANDLNRRGIERDAMGQWNAINVRTTLLNRPILIGDVSFKGVVYGTLKADPAMDRELYELVQAIFAGRKRTVGPKSLLSGLVTCGPCGSRRIKTHPMWYRGKRAYHDDGSVKRVYTCSSCVKLKIVSRDLDQVVKRYVIGVLSNPRHARQLAQRAVALSDHRGQLQQKITKLQAVLDALMTKYGPLLAEADEPEDVLRQHDKLADPVHAKLAALRSQLAELDADDSPLVPTEDVAAAWEEAVASGDLGPCRAMIAQVCPDLTVLPAVRVPLPGGGTTWGPISTRVDFTGESRREAAA